MKWPFLQRIAPAAPSFVSPKTRPNSPQNEAEIARLLRCLSQSQGAHAADKLALQHALESNERLASRVEALENRAPKRDELGRFVGKGV